MSLNNKICLNEYKDYLFINQILIDRNKAAYLIHKNYKIFKNKMKIKNLIFISSILTQRKKNQKKLYHHIKNYLYRLKIKKLIQNSKDDFYLITIQNKNNMIKFFFDSKNFKIYPLNYNKKLKEGKIPITKKKNSEIPTYIKISNYLLGFNNIGNSCYMNSSLQILFHIPEFLNIFIKYYQIIKNSNFLLNIFNFIKLIENSEKNGINSINPINILTIFKSNHLEFQGFSQRDSHLFLETFLWDINNDLIDLSINDHKEIKIVNEFSSKKHSEFNKFINEIEIDSNFLFQNIFFIYTISQKFCQCGGFQFNFNQSLDIVLSFNKDQWNKTIKLSTLLDQYFYINKEIDNLKKCKYCQKIYKLRENIRLAYLPNYIIINLQRTNENNTLKNESLVQYDETIDFSKYYDKQLINKKESYLYNLFAVNNHSGEVDSGHYYSYIKLEKYNNFYCFNDSNVNKLNKITPNQNNYILFYKKINVNED
jgi:ubiquitin C-terminal hydrolase